MTKRLSFIAGAIAIVVALAGSANAAPGTSVTGTITGTTLTISGTNGNDVLTLFANPPSAVIVDVGNDGTIDLSFDRSNFDTIVVNGYGGNDTIAVSSGGGLFTDTELTTLNGGDGNDDLRGGPGPETLLGGAGDDFVDGNLGLDRVVLGAGNDTFQWDPGDSSDTVDGQAGVDTIAFNGSNIGEHIELAPNGSQVLLTRDVAAITEVLTAIERVNVRALGGSDVVTVNNLAGTTMRDVTVDLATFTGEGDGTPDDVVARGTALVDRVNITAVNGETIATGLRPVMHVVRGEAALDRLVVETLEGNDKVTATPEAGAIVRPVIDGGAGIDKVTTNGTAGADTLGVAPGTANVGAVAVYNATSLYEAIVEEVLINGLGGPDTLSGMNGIGTRAHLTIDGGTGDDIVRGGDGNDKLLGGDGEDVVDGNLGSDTVLLGTGNDTFQWDPGDGSDTIQGQTGVDTLAFNASNASEIVDLANQSGKLRLTRNIGAITSLATGVERVAMRMLGGADNITVNDLAATNVTDVAIDLGDFAGVGDAAADTVTVKGTGRIDNITVAGNNGSANVTGLASPVHIDHAEIANDRLVIETGAGVDTVDPSGLAPDVIQLTIS